MEKVDACCHVSPGYHTQNLLNVGKLGIVELRSRWHYGLKRNGTFPKDFI